MKSQSAAIVLERTPGKKSIINDEGQEFNFEWGGIQQNNDGGLNFFDTKGGAVTAQEFSEQNNVGLRELIEEFSKDPGDLEFVDAYNRGIAAVGEPDEPHGKCDSKIFTQ